MSLIYDGKKIIPAPLVSINKTYNKTGDANKIGNKYQISLTGTLVKFRGSPSGNFTDINDSFWTLSGSPPDEPVVVSSGGDFNNILRKQEALRNLFSVDGKILEWQPSGGQPAVRLNPHVLSISFPPGRGQWTQGTDYTIELESDWILINGLGIEDPTATDLIQSFTDTWDFQQIEKANASGYDVSHTISAQGIQGYATDGSLFGGKESWEHARDFVLSRASGIIDSTQELNNTGTTVLEAGEFVKSQVTNKADGTFSLTEQWILRQNNAFTQRSFNVVIGKDNKTVVTHTGTITGLSVDKNSGDPSAIANAKAAIPTNSESQTLTTAAVGSIISPDVIGSSPNSKTIGINEDTGVVTFTFTYDVSEDTLFNREFQSVLSSEKTSGVNTLSLTTNVVGNGDTTAIKLTNARSGLLNEAAALTKAIAIIGTTLIGSLTFSVVKSKNTAINEKSATVNDNTVWDDSFSGSGLDIRLITQSPVEVFASIPAPGRVVGPVIQDMNTTTSEFISVQIVGIDQSSQPDGLTIAKALLSNSSLYLTIQNDQSFNVTKKTYTGNFRFIKKS